MGLDKTTLEAVTLPVDNRDFIARLMAEHTHTMGRFPFGKHRRRLYVGGKKLYHWQMALNHTRECLLWSGTPRGKLVVKTVSTKLFIIS